MTTSGFVFAIHSLERSKPLNTRCQYGSCVLPLSMAAPMAGTCDDDTPAMILATFAVRFAAIAFHRAAALEHHLGIFFLGGAGHDGGRLLEREPIGRAELGGEIDVAAELEHLVPIALEDGFALLGRQGELVEVFSFVLL